MKTAYRIPDNACACTEPGQPAAATVPIKRFDVRSFITNLTNGSRVRAGAETVVKGLAFDGGYGVTTVLFSADGGQSWTEANLGTDHGRYSFREWRVATHLVAGEHHLTVCSINRIGQSQPMAALWNPMGYMRNAVETVRVIAH